MQAGLEALALYWYWTSSKKPSLVLAGAGQCLAGRDGADVQGVGDAAVVGIVELHFGRDANVLWVTVSRLLSRARRDSHRRSTLPSCCSMFLRDL